MTATWAIRTVPKEQVTPEFLFGIAKRHRMVLDNVERMLAYCHATAPSSIVLELMTEDHEKAADIILSEIVVGDSASIDFIPVAKFYAPLLPDKSKNEVPFNELTRDAVAPILKHLMARKELRRITAMVPKSRNRTISALRECGFRREGCMRLAVKFAGKDPEDMVILGLLPETE